MARSLQAHLPAVRSKVTKIKSPTFIISERTQLTNLGDIVLNTVLLDRLAKYGQLITVKSNEKLPASLECAIAGTSSARLTIGELVALMMRSWFASKLWVICLNPGGYRGGASVSGLLRLVAYAAARLARIRLIRIGISVGPLTRARRYQERMLTRLTHCSAVRDRLSLAELCDSGARRVHLLPDLALLSSTFGPPSQSEWPRTLLAVSLRVGHKHARQSRVSFFADLCRGLSELCRRNGLQLAFVAQVQDDVSLLAELAQLAGAQLHVLDTNDADVMEKAGKLYASAAVLITNRLHAGIFAAMSGCVPIALVDPEEDRKITAMLADAGLTELIVPERDADKLIARAQGVLDTRDSWARRLRCKTRLASSAGRKELDRLIAMACGSASCVTHTA